MFSQLAIFLLSLPALALSQTQNSASRQTPQLAPSEPQQHFGHVDSLDKMHSLKAGDNGPSNAGGSVASKDPPGLLDSILGDGAQSRLVVSVNDWLVDKAKANPGCVERFVCETYKTGESMEGVPYFLMALTNAAVSFMVAEMFDKSVDPKEITRAARFGRTSGSCHAMECEFFDNQLRTVGDYLGTIEDFVSSIFSSISNSINIGK